MRSPGEKSSGFSGRTGWRAATAKGSRGRREAGGLPVEKTPLFQAELGQWRRRGDQGEGSANRTFQAGSGAGAMMALRAVHGMGQRVGHQDPKQQDAYPARSMSHFAGPLLETLTKLLLLITDYLLSLGHRSAIKGNVALRGREREREGEMGRKR